MEYKRGKIPGNPGGMQRDVVQRSRDRNVDAHLGMQKIHLQKVHIKRVLTALKIFIKRPNLHLGLIKQCSRGPTTLGVAWGGVICKGPESNIAITCGGSRDAEVQGLITAHEIAHLFGKYSNEMIVMVMVIELVFLVLQVGVTS